MSLIHRFTCFFFLLVIISFAGKSANNELARAEQLLSQRNYTASSALFEKLLAAATHRSEKALFHLRLAKIAVQTREFDGAKNYLYEANKYLSTTQSDSLAVEYHFIEGLLNYETEKSKDAMLSFDTALELAKTIYGENSRQVAICLIWVGNVYAHKFFQIPTGMEYYQKASGSHGVLSIEDEAFLNYNLARVHQTRRDIETSIVHLNHATKFYSTSWRFAAELADCHNLRALDFMCRGDTASFFQYEKLAISTVSQNGIGAHKLGKYYDNMGAVSKFTNSCYEAIGYYKKALETIEAEKFNETSLSNTYLNIGEYFADCEANTDSAVFFFKKSLSIRTKLYGEKHSEVSAVYLHIAETYASLELIDSALYYIQRALISEFPNFEEESLWHNPETISSGYGLQFISVLESKSKLLTKQYDKTSNVEYLRLAFNTLIRADSLLSSFRASFRWHESKLIFKAALTSIYNRALAYGDILFTKTGDETIVKSCFYLIENFRYSLLLDDVKNLPVINDKTLTLRKHLSELSQKMGTLAANNKLHSSLEKQRDSIKSTLLNQYDSSSTVNNFSDNVDKNVFDICRNFLNEDAFLLSYFWADSVLYTIGLSNTELIFSSIKCDYEFKQNLLDFKKSLISPPSNYSKVTVEAFASQGSYLYEKLIPKESKRYSKYIVLSDGPLTNLPFDALLTSNNSSRCLGYHCLPYLVRAKTLEYWYSFSIVNEFRKLPANDWDEELLAIAPLFGNRLKPLPGAASEANHLRTYGSDFTIVSQISKKALIDNLGAFEIIHLATHATADTLEGLNSFIELSDHTEDRLYAYDLLSVKFHPKLLVLTSCNTGNGEWQKGEGLYTLGRAFTAAGAQSLLMSAWKVPDDVTALLVNKFYQNFFEGAPPSEALRTSKLKFLQTADSFTAHPFYWASVYSMGNYQSHSFFSCKRTAFFVTVILVLMVTLRLVHQYKGS